MAENTVNNEENLNSQSSQLKEEDQQKLEAQSVPVNTKKPRVVAPWPLAKCMLILWLQAKHCTINFNTYEYALSNFPFMSSITFENPNAKIS